MGSVIPGHLHGRPASSAYQIYAPSIYSLMGTWAHCTWVLYVDAGLSATCQRRNASVRINSADDTSVEPGPGALSDNLRAASSTRQIDRCYRCASHVFWHVRRGSFVCCVGLFVLPEQGMPLMLRRPDRLVDDSHVLSPATRGREGE